MTVALTLITTTLSNSVGSSGAFVVVGRGAGKIRNCATYVQRGTDDKVAVLRKGECRKRGLKVSQDVLPEKHQKGSLDSAIMWCGCRG